MKRPDFQANWSDEVKAVHLHDLQEWWEPKRAPNIWRQYHNQLERYLAFAGGPQRLDILDVGCAQGTLALLLAEAGHRVVAVDLREEFLEYARSRHERGSVRFVRGNALELALEERFDLIFANQIVEHLVYPDLLFERLIHHLRPGGRLVVTTPNGRYLRNRLPSFSSLGNPARFEDRQFTADGDGHFFAFMPSELEQVARRAGLTEVEVDYFETPWASGHMKTRWITGHLPLSFVLAADRLTSRLPALGVRLCHQLMVHGLRR